MSQPILSMLVKAVADQLPKYNDYLLRGFQKKELAQAPQFVGTILEEAVKLLGPQIQYKDYKILSPEERLDIETARGYNIAPSELILVEYRFEFNKTIYKTRFYLPYDFNGYIVIRGTKLSLQKHIAEQIFSRTSEGITVKVIRAPLIFRRGRRHLMISETSDFTKYEFVITTTLYQKRVSGRKNSVLPTVLHYMLCKFGLVHTLERFGLTQADLHFTNTVSEDTDKYEYFAAKKTLKKKKPELYMKIRKELLDDPICSKLAAGLLYILAASNRHSLEDLYERTGAIFRILLGYIIRGGNEAQAKNQVDAHLASVDLYLDPITRDRLRNHGITVSNIYDLLQYIFVEIDRIIVNSTQSNLYNKRIDVTDSILVATIGNAIHRKFWEISRQNKGLDENTVKAALRFNPMLIDKLIMEKVVKSNPPLYGDNWLLAAGIRKLRQSGKKSSGGEGMVANAPEHRVHPSHFVVESALAFSKQNPGIAGSINPYVPISPDGVIIVPDYAQDIDNLSPYLPFQ